MAAHCVFCSKGAN